MVPGSKGERREELESQEAFHPLRPLKRDEVDWAAIYRTYCELPPGERLVLDLLVGRNEPKQVARQLGVTWNTVRNQIRSVRKKFAADSIQELVILVAIALYDCTF